MSYLDYGATSFHKPPQVSRAVERAMHTCASPGRGGYAAAEQAARVVFRAREEAGRLFFCRPEQVVFTMNCTHGLNIAIRSLVHPGGRVVISGFEHNAVTRPLHALNAALTVAGEKLFDWEDTLACFDRALQPGVEAAVVTHVSNVFGYILPLEDIARMCRDRGIPLIVDAAQSAGVLPLDFEGLGAAFLAMPGHKGLYGPQGTGLLLCSGDALPLLYGGTGSMSREQTMPEELPDRLEAGTQNVPGIAGLGAGMAWVRRRGPENLLLREHALLTLCAGKLSEAGLRVFSGPHQAATLSYLPHGDCEEEAQRLAEHGFALRAGLHCAPLAHRSAGTLETGTVRLSLGFDTTREDIEAFCACAARGKIRHPR